MPETNAQKLARLRAMLEDGDAESNADAFSRLVGLALDCPGDPYKALCLAAFGQYVQGERTFFDRWAAGLVAPAPLMRRKVVSGLRQAIGDRLIGE